MYKYDFMCLYCVYVCACMCIQELFLVPDHKIKDINGASFAGFYYICFQHDSGAMEGFYYHKLSEWYLL